LYPRARPLGVGNLRRNKKGMHCLDDGHHYSMDTFLGIFRGHMLSFYEMKEDGTKIDGVTNEEVIEVLIHRMRKLNDKLPCRENSIVITKLEECRFWLKKRTKDRIERKVEGTHES